jgi:hypothetical protein
VDRDKAFVVLPCSLHPVSSILCDFELAGELDFLFQNSLTLREAIFASIVCARCCEIDVVDKGLNIGVRWCCRGAIFGESSIWRAGGVKF